MRTTALAGALAVFLAAPVLGQTCRRSGEPDIGSLFPDSVQHLGRQFYNRLDGCTTNLYRPAAGEAGAWAAVSIEPNRDRFLGEDAAGLAAHYERKGAQYHRVDGWPVSFQVTDLGDEFVTLRGAVRITVLVKEGDGGPRSRALADTLLAAILPRVPCGGG